MTRTFRIPLRQFVGNAIGAAVLAAMAITPLWMIFTIGGQLRTMADIVGFVISVGMMLILFGGGAMVVSHAALHCLRCGVVFDGTAVSIRKIRREIHFNIKDAVRLQWNVPRGAAIIHLPDQKVRMDMSLFKPEDRLAIIRFIREHVPTDKQEGWPLFCHRVALRTYKALFNTSTASPPVVRSSDQILITRKRYDRLFMVVLPMTIVVALIAWRMANLPQLFIAPIVLLGWWAFIRCTVPKQGQVGEKMNGWLTAGGILLILFILFVAPLRYVRHIGEIYPVAIVIGLGGLLSLFMFIGFQKLDKAHKARTAAAIPVSVAQWDQIEHPQMDTAQ